MILLGACLAFASAACGGDDDGTTPGADATPGGPDAGNPDASGPAVGVACDTMTCSTSQVCCVTVSGDAGSAACVAPGTCEGASAACDGPEDCSGHACCGTFSGQTAMTECQSGDVCTGLAVQACHADTDCTANNMTTGTCCVAGTTGFCQFVGADCPQ